MAVGTYTSKKKVRKSFPLMAWPLPTPLNNGTAIEKKNTFFAASQMMYNIRIRPLLLSWAKAICSKLSWIVREAATKKSSFLSSHRSFFPYIKKKFFFP